MKQITPELGSRGLQVEAKAKTALQPDPPTQAGLVNMLSDEENSVTEDLGYGSEIGRG